MLFYFIFMTTIFYFNSNFVIGLTNQDLSELFFVDRDGPQYDASGYGDGDMSRNGESLMMTLIKPGDLVFDVGAHLGEWSLTALSLQPAISIYCFEPIPKLLSILEKNLQDKPVIISELALSNAKGKATFYHYVNFPGMSTLNRRPEVEKTLNLIPEIIEVSLERLDTFCELRQISTINFLKIDTEGNEFNVLLGAEGLLKKQAIEIIQFEYGGCYLDSNITLRQVYFYLNSFGYSIFRIVPEGLIEITNWRDNLENFNYSNYLAIRKE